MECLESGQLVKWLNGGLDESETTKIGEHIESCDACLLRLEDLTDDGSVNPPSDPENLLGGPTFTDEPNFQSMRKNLVEKVSGLAGPTRKLKPNGGEIQNGLRDIAIRSNVETIEQHAESTLTTDQPRELSPLSDTVIEIDGYHIEGLIGRGGFAHVYQAWDKQLERNVAIKVLDQARLNPRNRHRFLREAKTASSLESPHVVRVLTSGESGGQPYIVMELIQGQTLSAWTESVVAAKQIGSETIEQGVKFLIQICEGVQSVHDAGLVHRDIKPGNIFVDSANRVAKLGDFGLARILDQDTVTLTRAAELAGTPAYMSPEQTIPNGDVGPSSDVYSLGASLYQVLSGQPPFRGSSMAILKQVNDTQPAPPRQLNESVSRDLETICLKALEKSPRRRYSSSRDFADDLQRALDGKPITARPLSRLQKFGRWAKSNAALATTLGLLFLSMLAGTTFSTIMWLRADSAETRAVNDRTAALNSLTDLVDSLYQDLSDNAASIKARESVVQAAIDGLNSITKIRGDETADRTTMLAYRQLGYLKHLQGANDEAEKFYQASLGFARELDKQQGTNQSGCELANAISDLAIHYRELKQNEEAVLKLFAESSGILYELLVDDPENESALMQLVENHLYRLGSYKDQMAQAELLAEASKVLTDLERLMSLADVDDAAFDIAQRIHFQIGRAHFDLANLAKARNHFELAQTNLAKTMEATPNNTKLVELASQLNRAHALVASAMGSQEESLKLFSQGLISFEQLAAADPDNVSRKQQVANTYSLMSNPSHALAKHTEAINNLERAIEIYKPLLEQAPGDNMLRRIVAEACFKKANNQMYQLEWEDALASYKQTIHYLKSEDGELQKDPASINQIENSNLSINTIGLMTNKKWAVLDEGSECLALLHLARKDASTSTVDELSEESLAAIENINPEIDATTFDELFQHVKTLSDMPRDLFVYRLQFEARALGLRARNLADHPEMSEEQDELIVRAISILNIVRRMVPQAKVQLIFTEPDLTWLRNTEQYAAAKFAE